MTSRTVETLQSSEVRKHFLEILESDLPSGDKYDKFVSFFKVMDELTARLVGSRTSDPIKDERDVEIRVVKAAEDAGLWKPKEILERTEDSVRRAVDRITRCQHFDGGWGYEINTSNSWGTAHAVAAMMKAQQVFTNLPYQW